MGLYSYISASPQNISKIEPFKKLALRVPFNTITINIIQNSYRLKTYITIRQNVHQILSHYTRAVGDKKTLRRLRAVITGRMSPKI